jgi:hypothetical protein
VLKSIRPDKEGFYRNVPLMVIGKPSRNGILYDPTSTLHALSNDASRFVINLKEGNLEGEWGHPMVDTSTPSRAVLDRLCRIDRTLASHYISAIRTVQTDNGFIIVKGDVKPYGPYAQYLKDSMEDPNRNTAFSLRALTQDVENRGGITVRKVCLLVTFDAVDGPGFEEASKRYMSSTEALNQTYIFDQGRSASLTSADLCDPSVKKSLFSQETITDQQILDMMKSDVVRVRHETVGMYNSQTKMFIRSNGERVMPFHHIYGRAR